MAKTLLDIRTRVRQRLADTSSRIWTDNTQLNYWINEGYVELCIRPLILWRRSAPTELKDVLNQATYTLPATTHQVERLTWKGRKMTPVVTKQLEKAWPAFETTTGDVWGYSIAQGDGVSTLRKLGVPQATESVPGNVYLEDYYVPTALSADGSFFVVPDWMTRAVDWWAMHRAYRAGGSEGKGKNAKAASHYRTRFEQICARIAERKEAFHRIRVAQLGETHPMAGQKPPRPILPMNFGMPVRTRGRHRR